MPKKILTVFLEVVYFTENLQLSVSVWKFLKSSIFGLLITKLWTTQRICYIHCVSIKNVPLLFFWITPSNNGQFW